MRRNSAAAPIGALLLLGAAGVGIYLYTREPQSGPEASMRRYLMSRGVPSNQIIITSKVLLTSEGLRRIRKEQGRQLIATPGASWFVSWSAQGNGGVALVHKDGRVEVIRN